ncbi:MAG: hypothetical protein CSA38_01110 [Flavobacteriales bacterium]|nr:MAG: hypothetical protein CSA38_01110 [Flavobacteriales bacterium]
MKKIIVLSILTLSMSAVGVSCKKKKVEEVKTEEVSAVDKKEEVEVNAVDAEVLQKVNDALKDFPVEVKDVDGVLTLTGEVSAQQARKIKESIDALKIGKYNNELSVTTK